MVRIVSFGQFIRYARSPFHSKGHRCPSPRRPPLAMPSTTHCRSAARACSCSVCNTCLPCLAPRCWCPCSPVSRCRQRFCLLAWARYCSTSYRAVRCRHFWAHRLPLLPVMPQLRPTARPSFCPTPAWALPAPVCSIRCWQRCSAPLAPSALCASFRRW